MTIQNFNEINLSQQALPGSLTTPIIAIGAVTAENIGTLASVVIQDITYTAATGGTSGNSISITYIESVLPGYETVEISGSAITVNIGNATFSIVEVVDATHFQVSNTAGIQVGDTIVQGLNSTTVSSVVSVSELQVASTSGFVIGYATDNGLLSTATQVLTAIQNSYLASILINAAITGTPSNKQVGVGVTNLIGGIGSAVVSNIHADSNPNLTGSVQLSSGSGITLTQTGQSITVSTNGSDLPALTNDKIWIGNGSNIATAQTITGDAALSNTGTLTLVNTSVTPASYTNTSLTVDSKGRITSASSGITGNLTEAVSSIFSITGGTGAVLGTGTSIQVKQATTSQSGYLSSADWNTFNDKQPSGSYITALTGDATASGPGSSTLTLSTVNSDVGSFTNASITVNAKGLITAASSGSGGSVIPVTEITSSQSITTSGFYWWKPGHVGYTVTLPNASTVIGKPFYFNALQALNLITEYTVPTGNSGPAGICAGPDSNLWFAENSSNNIGKVTTSGSFTEYVVPTGASGPHDICTGPDGNIWFTELNVGQIGKVTTSGSFTEYVVPSGSGSGPLGICTGPDGNIWFTELNSNNIGKVTTSGSFTEYTIPTGSSNPLGICTGPDNNLWFTESSANKIGKVTTSGSFTEYTIPTGSSNPAGICVGPDGNIWFTENDGNNIGKVTTSGSFTEYTIPTASSGPYYICAGSDGNIWFTENAANKIGVINLSTFVITEYPIPTSGSNPLGICTGSDNNIWFAENATNNIGVITVPPALNLLQSVSGQTLDGINITASPKIISEALLNIISDGSNWYSL